MSIRDLVPEGMQQRRTSPTLIADVLREAILTGVLIGGQQLTQDEIAAQFSISRIPVREALRELQGEGLVTLHPHRGAMVSKLSAEELQELIEIRVGLETMAIRLAIPHLTDEVLERAERVLDAVDRDPEAAERWGQYNWEFHSALYEAANRPRLLQLIRAMHNNVVRYLRVQVSAMGYEQRGQQEHWRFLEACRRRDTDAASSLLEEHLMGVADLLVPFFELEARERERPDDGGRSEQ